MRQAHSSSSQTIATGSEATRYLCAGAYLDPEFADRVVEDVLDDEHRAVCPSYGIDLEPIVQHCLAARRRHLIRDSIVLVLLTGAAAVNWSGVYLSAFVLLVLWRITAGRSQGQTNTTRRSLSGRQVIAFVVVPSLLALPFWFLVLSIVIADLRRSAASVLGYFVVVTITPVLLAAALATVFLVDASSTRALLSGKLSFRPFQASPQPELHDRHLTKRLSQLRVGQYGNVTIYGGYDPFIGLGVELKSWSFAVELSGEDPKLAPQEVDPLVEVPTDDLEAKAPPDDPDEISVSGLLAAVTARLQKLGDPSLEPTRQFKGLQLHDRIYVSGLAVRGDKRFIDTDQPWLPPRINLPDDEVQAIIDDPNGPARHYLCVTVSSWDEEVVLSVLMHFSLQGEVLYVQLASRLLPPIKAEYHIVDALGDNSTDAAAGGSLLDTLRQAPHLTVAAPLAVLERALDTLRRDARRTARRRAVRENLAFNYGATISVREEGASPTFHNYFQQLDALHHLKVVERHVLAAIRGYLEEHGVDTAEYRARQTMILNSGILVSNADITNATFAAGEQAFAMNQMAGSGQPTAGPAAATT